MLNTLLSSIVLSPKAHITKACRTTPTHIIDWTLCIGIGGMMKSIIKELQIINTLFHIIQMEKSIKSTGVAAADIPMNTMSRIECHRMYMNSIGLMGIGNSTKSLITHMTTWTGLA